MRRVQEEANKYHLGRNKSMNHCLICTKAKRKMKKLNSIANHRTFRIKI